MPNAASLWETFQQKEGVSPRTVRQFTGRQKLRQDYYKLVRRAMEEEFRDYYIRNYYGIGGAGKSALLRRLEEELLGEEPDGLTPGPLQEARDRIKVQKGSRKPAVLRADFDDAALKTPEDVLLRFRTQLLHQCDTAMFPLFDMAMLRLSQKYGRRLPPDEQKALLTDNPVVSYALNVVGDLTGARLLIGAAQTAVKMGQGVARALAGRKRVIKKTNEEIARMDAPDLERRLPYYFAMDVNAMGLPLVCVYLDTYEKMTAQAEGAGRSTGFNEEWLQGELGLVRNLGNAVFAIAGREKLAWSGLPVEACPVAAPSGEETQAVEVQAVKALDEEESVAFLAACGIADRSLCLRIYELTGGEPLYLDLCVDEYERLRGSGRSVLTPEDFAGTRDRLVERHTRYIPQHLRDALYLLAEMGSWTDPLCEALSQTLPIPSPAGTGYAQLVRLSYVREEEGRWTMHRPVAEALAQELRPALRDRLVAALAEAAKRETQALFDGPQSGSGETGALDILAGCSPDPRTAQAMEERAAAACKTRRDPEALRWQEEAVAQWKALGGPYAVQYGESLAGLADLQWQQLNHQPAVVRTEEAEPEPLGGRRGWQALLGFCKQAVTVCEALGDGLDSALLRLWERRANAEDMLGDWDAAVSSWTQVQELARKLERPETVLRNAQLQIGWDRLLAGRWDEARAILEDTLQGFAALDRKPDRRDSPKTFLAAELLCQSYDALSLQGNGAWNGRLAQVQAWLRSLDITVTGNEPLEELLDWQDWVETSAASYGLHSGQEGISPAERLQRLADLDRQVVSGLAKHLDRHHPTVLRGIAALVELYMSQESSKGIGAVVDTDAIIQLMENGLQPLGSVPEPEECFFPDPETVLASCQELVELYTESMGREHPSTYGAKDKLARAYEMAGRSEEAVPLRRALWSYYSRTDGEASRTALYQNARLIASSRLAGRWREAVALQTRRLERAKEENIPALPLEPELERLCTLYLSWLWQGEPSQEEMQACLAGLLALTRERSLRDCERYLDSAFQWCQLYAGDSLDESAVEVALALSDTLSSETEVAELLEPYLEERSLPVRQRCALLFRLGGAYGTSRSSREQAVELLEELTELLASHPEVQYPDRGTALLALGLSRRKLAVSLVGDRFQETAQAMLEALREALAWREEHLSPEDPAVDEARFQLADALIWVGVRREAIPLLETVLAFRQTTLGEGARKTVEAELKLVEALARTENRYEEALARFRQANQRIKEQRLLLFTGTAQYALYRGSGGKLSYMEWQESGEPEQD